MKMAKIRRFMSNKDKVIVIISGGNVQAVYCDNLKLDVEIIDCDNLESDGILPEHIDTLITIKTKDLIDIY